MERKTNFSLSLPLSIIIIIIIITDPAGSGGWCLVWGSRGSGVRITHDSWLVLRQWTATQKHFPITTLKDSRLKTVCMHVNIYTYLVHGLH